MRKTELIVSGEVICPKTKASIVAHEHTNVEALLDQQNRTSSTITQTSAMSQVGVGDDMDLSFCVEDGFYESATLYGKTMVNCIQEPSEPSYVALGENLEFQNKKVEYTTDGQIKSAMLNGQTLVNLLNIKQYSSENKMKNNVSNMGLKSPSKYIFIADVNNSNANQLNIRYILEDGTSGGDIALVSRESNGKIKKVFTTPPNRQIKNISMYCVDVTTNPMSSDNMILMEYQEGMENWDIPYFQGMQSVTMTTELENVCSRYNSSGAKNGKTFTVGSINDRALKLADVANIGQYNFKQNTKYLIQFKIANLNLDGLSSTEIRFYTSSLESGNCLFENGSHVKVSKNGIYRAVFTTTSVINTSSFEIKGVATEWESSTSTTRKLTISQIMCIEYQNGMENWDLPYFETTQLMKPLKVQSVNKNVLDVPLLYKVAFQGGERQVWSDYWGTEEYVKVQPNTTYTFRNSLNKPIYYGIVFYNRAKEVVYWQNNNIGKTFTTTSDTYYVRFALNSPQASEPLNCQLEEGSTSTDYIPHQSKTISALEPITLRAIGNVKDTLDLSTGEYVQRIGEIVYDGSNDENWEAIRANNITGSGGGLTYFRIPLSTLLKTTNQDNIPNSIINDKIKVVSYNTLFISTSLSESLLMSTVYSSGLSIQCVYIYYNNSSNVSEFKTYLSQNPVKVQYQLAKPITRKIPLEYPNLQTYTDITHVQSIAMDGTLIPKIFLPSDISYKAMLKPNTSYNVIVDREVIDSTNQLTVNLGGATASTTVGNRVTTVTTPSTLSNELLTISGRGNKLSNVMVIEGDVVGDEPYFEGICDCKSPILSNVGENLFDINAYSVLNKYATVYENTISVNAPTGYSNTLYPIRLRAGKRYTLTLTKENKGEFSIRQLDTTSVVFFENETGNITKTFVCPEDDLQIRVGNRQTTGQDCVFKNIQIIESSIAKEYEPYKSNTTTFNQKDDKTIVLRSLPNGVCDTLNVETGEYVQRIGEVMFDGSENWDSHSNNSTYTSSKIFALKNNLGTNTEPNCDKFAATNGSIAMQDGLERIKHTATHTYINITNNRYGGGGSKDFKTWLSQNPVTVQYELATPIVSTIDVQGFPYAYANGHVQLSSGSIEQSLTPKVEYVVQTNRAGAIQANQDRLLNHDKRLAMLEDLVLHQLIQLEYNRAKCTFLSQTRQIFEGGIQMYHTKYELLSEFIEKKLYRSLEEVFEMLDVYFMLGDITDGEYDALYEALMPSTEEFIEVEETFDHEDVEV